MLHLNFNFRKKFLIKNIQQIGLIVKWEVIDDAGKVMICFYFPVKIQA